MLRLLLGLTVTTLGGLAAALLCPANELLRGVAVLEPMLPLELLLEGVDGAGLVIDGAFLAKELLADGARAPTERPGCTIELRLLADTLDERLGGAVVERLVLRLDAPAVLLRLGGLEGVALLTDDLTEAVALAVLREVPALRDEDALGAGDDFAAGWLL